MATGLARGPSGYGSAQISVVAPEYSPTQAPRLIRAGSSGGGSTTPGIVKYRPPAYDEAKIKAYQQEALAPGVSGLRRSMREVQAGRYKSPSARREALRGAMRGYGETLSSLQVGAGAQARQRYNIQYQQEIAAERQRVAAEERAAEREYQESLRDEAKEEQEEVDRVIIGYNAAGFPIYGTSEEAAQRAAAPEWVGHSTTGYRTGEPAQIIDLTEASRRPISDEPEYGRSLYPESVSPELDYPTNWMT